MFIKPNMDNQQKKRHWFVFAPESDTWLALLSIPLMTIIYYLNTRYGYEQPIVFFGGFVVMGHLFINTTLPAYVVLKLRGEGLEGLGITRNWLITSIVISITLGAFMYPALSESLVDFEGNVAPNIAYNAIALWEPLFVFGWLQLRFERAFGIIAGIVMAGIGFAAYHLGSFPVEALIVFLFTGMIYGAIFAIVRNLLVLIPVTWAVASTMGTIEGGFSFDWSTVGIYAGVLCLQVVILIYFHKFKKSSYKTR